MNPENDGEPTPAADEAATASGGAAPAGEAATERPGSADVHAYIGRQLRAVYDDVAKQPIPDRFLELMRQLEGRAAEG